MNRKERIIEAIGEVIDFVLDALPLTILVASIFYITKSQ